MSTVGKALESLTNSVNTVIEQESAIPGENSHFEAARDVSMAIGNAVVAYGYPGILEVLEEKVEASVQDRLAELRSMVALLESRQTAESVSLFSRVQMFIHALPLAKWQPKLTGISPRCVALIGGSYQVSFLGEFQHAGSYKSAKLILGEDYLKLTPHTTENTLSFLAPFPLGCFSSISQDNWHTLKGTLKVEYYVGGWFNSYRTASYPIHVRTYPAGPGRIKVTYPKLTSRIVEKLHRSATFSVSRKDFPEEQLIERALVVLPSPGWKISGPIYPKGLNDLSKVQSFRGQVYVTLCLPADQDKVKTHIEFTETKEEQVEIEHSEWVKLKWGGYVGFETSKLHVELESFDGQKFELNDPEEKIPYLQITRSKYGFLLIATSPTP